MSLENGHQEADSQECPVCGGPTVAVLEVSSVGTGGPRELEGFACVELNEETHGWVLHVHEDQGDLS